MLFKNFRKKPNRLIWSRGEGNFITYRRALFFSKKKRSIIFHKRTTDILCKLIDENITNKIVYSTKAKKGWYKAYREYIALDNTWYNLHNGKAIELCNNMIEEIFGGVIPTVIYYKIEK
jgi:hypothetical protein